MYVSLDTSSRLDYIALLPDVFYILDVDRAWLEWQ